MPPKETWYIYIIETDRSTLYTGITTDVERRFGEHLDMFEGKSGAKGAKYFRGVKPMRIVYSEGCADRSSASKREAAIKRLPKARKLALITDHEERTTMSSTATADTLTVGIAQIAPVWLNRDRTLEKILTNIKAAAKQKCQLVTLGEALLPGYPFWIEQTDGARFNSAVQKEIHAHYIQNAIQVEAGDLDPICDAASRNQIAIVLGCIERAADRGGHSLYASLIYIDPTGAIGSVHRKLMPTYEERLTWSPGDGHGLRVHKLGPFTVGGLNCWENWMPLARAALYGQGEDLHVAIWPGSERNTRDITRFIAMEARSFVISASSLMRKSDFPPETPHLDKILADCPDILADGGSCIAGPDGEWVVAPVVGEERLIVATLEHKQVRMERQNFDPAGHYSRPDVTQLTVNRARQSTLNLVD